MYKKTLYMLYYKVDMTFCQIRQDTNHQEKQCI